MPRLNLRPFCVVAAFVLLVSCGGENPAIEKLIEVHAAIQKAESIDELYPYLTENSREYFSYLTQEKVETIQEKLWAGNNVGLMFTTALYAQQGDVSGDSTEAKFNETYVLHRLKTSGNPVFSWNGVPRIKEDQSECCNPALVTVLVKLDNSTFITKKINFEGPADALKLDVYSVLKSDERLLAQSFAQFKEPSLLGATSQKDLRRIATLTAQANPNDPACVAFVEAVLSGEYVVGGSVIYKK